MDENNTLNEEKVISKYQKAIDYYLRASTSNKKSYRLSRVSIVVLGASITFLSSLASANFIVDNQFLKVFFAVITPLLAVLLTIISGLSQSFHWGAAWRDMIMNAQKLEKARDLFQATKPEERDIKKELDSMHDMVITETESFFQRVLEAEIKPGKNKTPEKP
jgi:hypothetical protein